VREGQLQRRDLHKREDGWYFGVYYREARFASDCPPAGERMIDKLWSRHLPQNVSLSAMDREGYYVRYRVFFADERTAVAAGYRLCAVCLPDQ
jgi:hypothetical protein